VTEGRLFGFVGATDTSSRAPGALTNGPTVTDPASLVADLNPNQRAAVLYNKGPLVVVAGAGSGKTRVLTRRIGRILAEGVHPQQILAITFTNKAADEMRHRVRELIGARADGMWISTFHSMCVRILRREASSTAWRSGFSIYDDGDSRRLVEHVLEDLGIDQKRFPPRAVAGAISAAKGEMRTGTEYEARSTTMYEERIAQVFIEYERRLIAANAMDFDDLLSETVRLLRRDPEVAERYQERFVHLLVDEYQDTNRAQNELVVTLGARWRNVCVVGDSDQSIYRFRGAEVRNLLDFEHAFPDAETIVLDQNYRSTQRILDAANAVIGHNLVREEKKLWSAIGEGEPIVRYKAGDEREEATFVANEIARLRSDESTPLGAQAVFYRTNAQSRAIEQALADRGLPYQVIGGTRFYDRREIRDCLAYVRLVRNPLDEVSLRRVLNVPRRGVGQTSINRLVDHARTEGVAFFSALRAAGGAGVTGRALGGIAAFLELVDGLGSLADRPPGEVITEVLGRTGYLAELEAEASSVGVARIEAEGRIENLAELCTVAENFEDLEGFLEATALVSATDDLDDSGGRVSLMTLHAAKGLEFSAVFLTGLEEGIFPHDRALSDPEDLEEERRLCYVGITRARDRLYLTSTWYRTVFGQGRDSISSRFLKEIPDALVVDVGSTAISTGGQFGDASRFSVGRSFGAGGRAGTTGPQSPRALPVHGTGAETLGLGVGDAIVHTRWGEGRIVSITGEGDKQEAVIAFPRHGTKTFLLALTPLKRA
jgi:DNA helicase-2/ATP-dependent DNA helicase PcrA